MVAFVLFLLGSSAIYYLKRIFDKFWLARSQISKNSRETVLTLCGYLAYAILLLVTLQTAGFRLTGLSMILGAFSVGIGFGLQNVVNNFISGLILMFEQPIKKGNWVKVGGEEGYVKKISIRSTVIQTFDRSDVIVPNSELISSQVTNMMLNDIRGRIKVPVGVAYGTDTRLVERLLLEVAADNENVISPPHRLQHNRNRVARHLFLPGRGEPAFSCGSGCGTSSASGSARRRQDVPACLFHSRRSCLQTRPPVNCPQRQGCGWRYGQGTSGHG